MTDVDVCRGGASNPLVAQVETVMRGHGRELSPDAANYPPVAEALVRTQSMPVVFTSGPVASFLLANCGRKIQAEQPRSEADLRRISVAQAAQRGPGGVAEFNRQEADHDLSADVAVRGGSPIQTVVLYGVEGVGNQGSVVSAYWTPRRGAEVVSRGFRVHHCMFCSAYSETRYDIFLLVGCGGVLKIMACCWHCESDFRNHGPRGG